jgi:ABC-2 type transport system permease protein/capsular polysaccharide transport system permease protein
VIQLRVIAALLMREVLTRYGRHNLGFLWLFLEPMMFTVGVTVLWNLTRSAHGSNLPITAFAVTGYSAVLLWRNMPSRCILAILPNQGLLYHRNVKVFDIYASRLTLEALGAGCSFVILTIVFYCLGWMKLPEDVLQVITGWLLLVWFGFAIAIFVGALSEQYEIVDKIWHPITYLSFPLSGAAFIVDALPKGAQDFMLWIPMVNATEYMREGFFGGVFNAHYDLSYLIVFNLILTLMGLAEARKVGQMVMPE